MMKRKKAIGVSKDPDAGSSEDAVNSEEVTIVPSDNVEVVANTRVRRGRKNASKASTGIGVTAADETKKRVRKEEDTSVSGSASNNADEILDNEADVTEPSEEVPTEPDIAVSEEVTNDDVTADPTQQMTNMEEVEAAGEPGSEDTTEALNYIADEDSAVTDLSEKVSNVDNVIEDAVVGAAERSKVSSEALEEVAAINEQSEVTTETLDVSEPAGELLENTVDDDVIANKRPRLEETDTSKAGGSTTASQPDILQRKIFVGGLPNTITEDNLREYFETYGRVIDIDLLRYRDTNRTRGFAFVVFDNEDCANKCIEQRSHEICKKVCEVKKVNKNRLVNNSVGLGNRRSSVYNNRNNPRQNQQVNIHGVRIQQMFQQALLMGQRNLYRPPVLASPASFLLNRAAVVNPLPGAVHPTHNMLLQALINKQVAQASAPVRRMVVPASAPVRPMIAPVVRTAPGNIAALNLLAQRMKSYSNTQLSNYRPRR